MQHTAHYLRGSLWPVSCIRGTTRHTGRRRAAHDWSQRKLGCGPKVALMPHCKGTLARLHFTLRRSSLPQSIVDQLAAESDSSSTVRRQHT